MTYYPKSQIKTGLYTSGKEYKYKDTQQEYVGSYYIISTGQVYSGNPTDKTSVLLEKYSNVVEDYFSSPPSIDVLRYNKLRGISNFSQVNNNAVPQSGYNLPSEEDYKNGEFYRFFCKRINNLLYLEVDKQTFEYFNNNTTLYQPFYIIWHLTGDKQYVYQTNKNIVNLEIQRKQLHKFDVFLKQDYLKYYK